MIVSGWLGHSVLPYHTVQVVWRICSVWLLNTVHNAAAQHVVVQDAAIHVDVQHAAVQHVVVTVSSCLA